MSMRRYTQSNKSKIRIFNKKLKVQSEDEIIENLRTAYNEINLDKIRQFADFPLSEKTLKGLTDNKYIHPTEIQRDSIGFSLKGEDILGAAKTGSGKTLAFIIPLLEMLYCRKWTALDGLGALVITPTRELAYQIFETLKRVGSYHDFSAGLIIGGKDLKFERKRMDKCNIVICTPGRLLQHMDENPLFDCSSMQILILDEADRCLDMGFEQTMNSIIDNLPLERQTMLFSATQTKSVKDLARLSLKNPRYVSVHEDAKYSTPSNLVQSYIICELQDKINFLWSFIKNHRKHKVLVFLSSCKQVKYVYEAFCRLKPGVSLMALYGTLHQSRRMTIYDTFCQKQHAILFATDIAARGLDFPAVNWVIQLDCPETANEYIHRAGRTARYQKAGESLLLLLPAELKMLEHLEVKRIPIDEIKTNASKLQSIQRNLEALLARDTNLKESAQRAFVAYVKSVFLMKDKDVFKVTSMDTDSFARSLGLAVPPRIRFLQKWKKTQQDKMLKQTNQESGLMEKITPNDEEDIPIEENGICENKSASKANVYNFYDEDDNEENGNDFLQLKRIDHQLDTENEHTNDIINPVVSRKAKKPLTHAAVVKKILKKKILPNKKTVFNEDGEVIIDKTKEYVSDVARRYAESNEGGIDIPTAKLVLKEEDKHDKELFRQKVKQKHREQRRKIRDERRKKRDEEEQDDFEEEDSGSEPDLSWLPDPDKVYQQESDNDDENSLSDSSSIEAASENNSDTEIKTKLNNKRTAPSNKTKIKSKKRKLKTNDQDNDIGLTLSQQEEIALQLMQMNQ